MELNKIQSFIYDVIRGHSSNNNPYSGPSTQRVLIHYKTLQTMALGTAESIMWTLEFSEDDVINSLNFLEEHGLISQTSTILREMVWIINDPSKIVANRLNAK